METTTFTKATARAAAFSAAVQMSGAVRGGFQASLALLPLRTLSITGGVRPVTATVNADEHNVRTWSPPV